MAGEPLTLRAQFAGLGISTERKTDAAQQRGGLGGVGVKAHPAKTVVGLSQMRLGRSRIGKDEFHDAGEVLDLEERMTQAEFGDRAPGRTDHPSCRGIVAAIRLQDGLAPRRRRLDSRRVSRDPEQPHHVQTPPARARNGVGSPQRGKRRARQHCVHPAVFTRTSRRGESIVERNLAVANAPEPGQAGSSDSVRLGFPCGIVQLGQLVGGRTHRGFDVVQSIRMNQHRELAVEAGRPCCESV